MPDLLDTADAAARAGSSLAWAQIDATTHRATVGALTIDLVNLEDGWGVAATVALTGFPPTQYNRSFAAGWATYEDVLTHAERRAQQWQDFIRAQAESDLAAACAENARLRQALQDILDPVAWLRRGLKPGEELLYGETMRWAERLETLRGFAREALETPDA